MTDDGRVHMQAFPPLQGLYDGAHEHDACGVAFVATMTGVPSHAIVSQALTALRTADTTVERVSLVLFDDRTLEIAQEVAAESEQQ